MKYFILLLLLIVACGSDEPDNNITIDMADNNTTDMGSISDDGNQEDMAVVYTSLDDRPCPDDSDLTYENFGQGFMLNWCTSCHHSDLAADMRQNAPVGADFDTVEGVRTIADVVWARTADQNETMPPLGGPSQTERTDLGEWLACGAP